MECDDNTSAMECDDNDEIASVVGYDDIQYPRAIPGGGISSGQRPIAVGGTSCLSPIQVWAVVTVYIVFLPAVMNRIASIISDLVFLSMIGFISATLFVFWPLNSSTIPCTSPRILKHRFHISVCGERPDLLVDRCSRTNLLRPSLHDPRSVLLRCPQSSLLAIESAPVNPARKVRFRLGMAHIRVRLYLIASG